jgi:hypothetical protein
MTHSMMCSSVAHLVEARHDGELAYDEQIAVDAHLAVCASCSAAARELRDLQTVLNHESLSSGSAWQPHGTPARLESQLAAMRENVLGRVRAERHDRFTAQIARMFEDLHFVWAGLAAVTATAVCVAAMASVWHFAPTPRADSLSGVLSALAEPGSDRNPMRLDEGTQLPRVDPADVMPAMLVAMPDASAAKPMSMTITGVLTQEGRVQYAAVLPAGKYGDLDARRVMHTVSSTRFRPAQRHGAPVAVNLIWVFEQTTVLGKRGA